MDAYIYQAALYCTDCAELRKERITYRGETIDEDSDRWPQGPYADGGGEADYPQHCDDCGVFLENPLTRDGEAYVVESAAEDVRQSAATPRGVVTEWRAFYSYLFEED